MTATSAAGLPAGAAVRPRRRARPTPRAVLLVVVILALLFAGTVPFRTYLAQRDQLARLEHQSELLERQNALLDKQIKRLHDPQYLERLARACLGMVRPGEIHFAVTGKGVAGEGGSTSGSGLGTPADC
jgi:cell division protein FtsB